jgi:hypothetical protein
MHAARPIGVRLAPGVAAVIALALLASPLWPAVFPVVVAGASIAACALALTRRPSRPLVLALAGIALWLALGLAGAWLLRGRPIGGSGWVLGVLYLLPLPVIPWLYWTTLEERKR